MFTRVLSTRSGELAQERRARQLLEAKTDRAVVFVKKHDLVCCLEELFEKCLVLKKGQPFGEELFDFLVFNVKSWGV